jgi:hypothetical protein
MTALNIRITYGDSENKINKKNTENPIINNVDAIKKPPK